jgi:hypothetical protein
MKHCFLHKALAIYKYLRGVEMKRWIFEDEAVLSA